ncbi:toxin-antitoxin system, toxin component [Streptomyces sp. MMG1522]|nr:toxin-antitoxin system, toxin component [Streptomyces sp. MMG1522]
MAVAKGLLVTTETPRWFTSSYSNNGGQCVEIATNLAAPHGIVPVRDSKDTAGPALSVRSGAFSAFVTGIKSGEL